MDKKKDFFDNTNLDNIDREIKAHLSRPTLVKQLKDQNAQKTAESERGLNWSSEWKKYWYVYVFLLISGMFTGTLGIYMGLSPTMVTDATGTFIHFNTDVGHVLLAVVYFVAFIGVTEAAFAIAKWKYFTREERNKTQQNTMITAMGIAALSILGTGIAGGSVVASNIAFLSEFVEISPTAQKWVVIAIPVLIVIYTILFSAYALSSDSAASERLMNETERERELDNRTRMNAIEQIAAEKLQAAEIAAFQRLVEDGVMSSAQALAAIRAGRSLKQEEAYQGRDLDGDGVVGQRPAQKAIPDGYHLFPPVDEPPIGSKARNKHYHDMETFLSVVRMTKGQAKAHWIAATYEEFVAEVLPQFEYIGSQNLYDIWQELTADRVPVKFRSNGNSTGNF